MWDWFVVSDLSKTGSANFSGYIFKWGYPCYVALLCSIGRTAKGCFVLINMHTNIYLDVQLPVTHANVFSLSVTGEHIFMDGYFCMEN